MPMGTEDDRQGRPISMTREPVGPKNAASKGSIGDTALKDGLIIVGCAWAVLFLLMFSLRRHNI
jgi:predicted metal-binding membrane protein